MQRRSFPLFCFSQLFSNASQALLLHRLAEHHAPESEKTRAGAPAAASLHDEDVSEDEEEVEEKEKEKEDEEGFLATTSKVNERTAKMTGQDAKPESYVIPRKAAKKRPVEEVLELSDDDSIEPLSDRKFVLVKTVSRFIPPQIRFLPEGATLLAGYALCTAMDNAMWFPESAGGGGHLSAHLSTLRRDIQTGVSAKKDLLQNTNNKITSVLSPLYQWHTIKSDFDLLTTVPTLPVVVVFQPHYAFRGFAVFGGWIYNPADGKTHCTPLNRHSLIEVGYLTLKPTTTEGVDVPALENNSATEMPNTEEGNDTDTTNVAPEAAKSYQNTSEEEAEYEVTKGVKHFAVAHNVDVQARR